MLLGDPSKSFFDSLDPISKADITALLNHLVSAGESRRYVKIADILISSARLPLCERPDIGNFTALVGPGIDRPEFVGLAILDHCRIVRTLSE